MGFCISKGDNQKIFNFRAGKFVNFIQTFGHLVSLSYNLVLVLCIFDTILEFLFFFREIVTSLAYNFSMQKSLLKTFLDVKFLFVNRFFSALFRTKGMLNHDNIIFLQG